MKALTFVLAVLVLVSGCVLEPDYGLSAEITRIAGGYELDYVVQNGDLEVQSVTLRLEIVLVSGPLGSVSHHEIVLGSMAPGASITGTFTVKTSAVLRDASLFVQEVVF